MLARHHVLGGRYRVGRLIGRRGMADVRRGDDLVTGEAVALKVLRAVPSLDRWSAREVAALSRLDHDAVVRLWAWDLAGSIVGVAGGLAVARDRGNDSTPPVVTSVPGTGAPPSTLPPTTPPLPTAKATTPTTRPKKGKGHDKAGGGG